jgi:hypothetical protein
VTENTPNTVSALCRTLALYRKELAKSPSAEKAISIQKTKQLIDEATSELRAGFKLLSFR